MACDVFASCYSDFYKDLIKTLHEASTPNTLILFSHELRDIKEAQFYQLLKESFSFSKIPSSKLDPLWQSDDIAIFHVKKL